MKKFRKIFIIIALLLITVGCARENQAGNEGKKDFKVNYQNKASVDLKTKSLQFDIESI